jgi:uncharacterized protein YyaL (SSP411 family)
MPNRLAQETSPYLRQHADNPVDWYPWGEEALALARATSRPILLSIGYSACHWCHVMAHESFEDPAVAALMNAHYVNIKVDREERPDLDHIYQTAHHLLTQKSGGWPLTMFLMPDTTPFFAGTYFPKDSRHGRPGFRDLLPRIAAFQREHPEEIAKQNASLLDALGRTRPQTGAGGVLDAHPIDAAWDGFERAFDPVHGGIGRAPKFPHPSELAFCLGRHAAGVGGALAHVRRALTGMAEGGIYDHLAGGFCRYSTDDRWSIPHFEKMLYDNGSLLALYCDGWLATREPRYANVVAETASWVIRDMQSAAGGFHSSFDADSEGEEGRFYIWTPEVVRACLNADEFAVAAPHYGLDVAPNFEGRHWHLRVARPLDAVARDLGLAAETCAALLASARARLLAARNARVWPGRDDKILTSWNALMAKGMLRAARVFDVPEWEAAAWRCLDFLRATMWRDGRLLATHKDGRTHLNAYLDDYAFLLDALLESMQGVYRPEDLAWATAIADALLAHFEDPAAGGFFFTSHDHETLIYRAKTGYDNATPSGNGIAAHALQRLGHLTGDMRLLNTAERALRLFFPAMSRQPTGHASLLVALEEHLEPPTVVVIRGPVAALPQWRRRLAGDLAPHRMALFLPEGTAGLPTTLDKPVVAGKVNAWICTGVNCLPPILDPAELDRVLAEPGQSRKTV